MFFKLFFRKAINVPAERTHFGRLFHIRGPVIAKLLCPTVSFDIFTLRNVAINVTR